MHLAESIVSTKLPNGDTVLLDVESELYFGLNPVGTIVWEALRDGDDRDAIVARCLSEFEVDSTTVEADIDDLLSDMRQRGILTD